MWTITSEEAFKTKYVAALGEAEFNRRKTIADAKADGLSDWHERIFMRPQFVSVAMQLTQEQFAAVENWPPDRWVRFICKLAR